MTYHADNSINNLFKSYIHECKYASCRSAVTIRGYEAVFILFRQLMPEVDTTVSLTPEMLIEFFRRLQTRERKVGKVHVTTGVKNTTIRTYRSKLFSFFTWLQINGQIKENPLAKLPLPRVMNTNKPNITELDIRKLYAAVALHSKNTFLLRRDTLMISILYFCGLRLGEFISLEIRDIDLVNELLTVRASTSKAQKQRYIPIHPTLLFHLKEYLIELRVRKYTTPYLIVSTSKNKALSRHGLKHWVANLGQKAEVRFHLHQFRHAFACNLASKDVTAVKIQKLLGHSSLNMTMHYLQSIDSRDLREDINRLSI